MKKSAHREVSVQLNAKILIKRYGKQEEIEELHLLVAEKNKVLNGKRDFHVDFFSYVRILACNQKSMFAALLIRCEFIGVCSVTTRWQLVKLFNNARYLIINLFVHYFVHFPSERVWYPQIIRGLEKKLSKVENSFKGDCFCAQGHSFADFVPSTQSHGQGAMLDRVS